MEVLASVDVRTSRNLQEKGGRLDQRGMMMPYRTANANTCTMHPPFGDAVHKYGDPKLRGYLGN